MTAAFALLSPVLSAPLIAQITNSTQSIAAPFAVRILPSARPQTIPNTIFGTFLEPIGHSTYGGLWADVVENPSFESGLWSADRVVTMLKERPELRRASDLALPLPWEPLDPSQGARYLPVRGDAANSDESLLVMSVPGKESGIRQRVYLPVHRELTYRGTLWTKHVLGGSRISVSLRRDAEPGRTTTEASGTLAEASFDAPETTWTKHTFTLTLKPNTVAPLEPVYLAISLNDGARAQFDNAGLVPADAVDGLDPDVVAMSREMHTPLVRFGGNFTSGYDWHDGVGPLDKRVSMLNASWGIPEYNTFGTDEFLDFCRLIHAQPQFALNLGSGTPKMDADWVRYIDDHWNGGKGGLLWELGNELWGNWQIGAPTIGTIGPLTGRFAEAVHAVDPHARLIATGGVDDSFHEWNANQLANQPGSFDYLSTHYVVGDDVSLQNPSQQFRTMADLALPIGLEARVRGIRQQAQASANGKDVKAAFTEWLLISRTHGGPSFTNMGGAVFAGGFLNMLLRNTGSVPVSDMTGILEFAGIWQKRGQVYGTPAYWVFREYASADPATALTVESGSPTYSVANGVRTLPTIAGVPYLDISAALSSDRKMLLLFCVNRNLTDALTAKFDLSAVGAAAGPVRLSTVSAANLLVENDEEDPNRVKPAEDTQRVKGELTHTFPNSSVTVIKVPLR